MAAATQSATRQNGGHHRVLATNWRRCCQRSLSPWPTRPMTISHNDPVAATAATTTKIDEAIRYWRSLAIACAREQRGPSVPRLPSLLLSMRRGTVATGSRVAAPRAKRQRLRRRRAQGPAIAAVAQPSPTGEIVRHGGGSGRLVALGRRPAGERAHGSLRRTRNEHTSPSGSTRHRPDRLARSAITP
jgi:hypothetical protein